jgi:hypothetical protein
MKKVIIFLVAVGGFAVSSFGQASVTANAPATANIVTPLGITKTVDMNFGNIAVNANAGTVILSTTNTRTVTGGITLPGTAGTVAAAQFSVTGQNGYTYSITMPSSALTLTRTSGSETMTVDTWVNNVGPTGTLSVSGAQTIIVGATLNVGGSQVAGEYKNTTGFPITVNYN